MRKVSIFIVFMTTLLLSSCNNKLSYKQAIKRSYGQEIDFSWDKRLIMIIHKLNNNNYEE